MVVTQLLHVHVQLIHLVDITVSISTSGTNTAGGNYSLECYATVTESTDQPTITWLDAMNNPVPSEMVNTTGFMSTLTFDPLAVSHSGTYTCRVAVGGAVQTATEAVAVQGKCSLPVSLHPVCMSSIILLE